MYKKTLNSIKMETYTCFKSKIVWIVLGVVFVLSVISLYTSYSVINHGNINIGENDIETFLTVVDQNKVGCFFYWCKDLISGDFLLLFTIVFSALIVGKDYTSGYIKSIVNRNNRYSYIIAKTVLILVFIGLMIFTTVLATIICKFVFLDITDIGNFGEYMKMLGVQMLLNLVIGVLVEAICVISKKQVVSLLVPLIYYLIFSDKIYTLINKAINKQAFSIDKYAVFGIPKYLEGDLSAKLTYNTLIVLLIYLILFVFLACKGMKKSDI